MTTTTARPTGARTVRAPRGPTKTCKTWQAEAAMRMLMNNLDPEVAENPDELVVYGGRGQAVRSWEAFDAIVDALKKLSRTRRCSFNRANPLVYVKPPSSRRA